MSDSSTYDAAVARLRTVLELARTGDPRVLEIKTVVEARDGVLPRYQPLFAPSNLAQLTEKEFRSFLHFKNNRHWVSLQRLGPRICRDMGRLREALAILLDEGRPIRDRLNTLVPGRGASFVPGLGKAVLTPILLICHPDKYCVWNKTSEAGMRTLEIWPDFGRSEPFGNRYEAVNQLVLGLSHDVGVDLWTLDALWWRIEIFAPRADEGETDSQILDPVERAARFGLERHLHEFLRDNWDHLSLAKEWSLHEEDGDPDAGFEYPCEVGRIDLLARHRTEPRWLVIELKRDRSTDKTIGQVLRYIGWVQQELAGEGDRVEGLIISNNADPQLRYALRATPNVRLMLYEVDFRLQESDA